MRSSFLSLLVRWVVTALGVVIATRLVPGIHYDDGLTLMVVVIVLSFLNAAIRPFLLLMTLPFIILTAGIGIVIVNALLFLFVGKLVNGFHVDGFWPALWGSLIVSFTSMMLSVLLRSGAPRRRPQSPPPSSPQNPPQQSGGKRADDVIDI